MYKFIDREMIFVGTQYEKCVFEELGKAVLNLKIGVHIDEERLKKWIKMCLELENIDKTLLIDMAIKQKFEEKDKEIERLHKIIDIQKNHIDSIEQHFRGRGTKRTGNLILDFKLEIRKQVCDAIRNYIDKEIWNRFGDEDVDCLTIDLEEFESLLQDLELAKESLK